MPSNKLHTELLISAGVDGLDRIDRVIESLRAAGEDTEQLAEESARLRREWNDLDPQRQAERMRNLGEATNRASEDAERLGDTTERNVGAFERMRGAIVAIGAALGVAFVVGKIKAFFSDAVAGASGFESQMATVKAISGATAEEMEKLRAAAEKMGSETRYTATEAAQGLEILARAGLDANESINTLPSVLALAQGNSLELADAAGYITQAVQGMGLSMDDAGRVADVLAKAAASANTDVQGLGDALSYAAPSAAALGVDLESTVAYLGKFADAGFAGTRAGTALNNMMGQFANPASTFRRELAAIGIRTNDFNEAIRQLAAAGPKAQNAINALGQEAGPAMKALLSQGIDSLDELKGKLDDAGGTAAKQAAEMDNTLAGAFASLQSAWQGLKQNLATPILAPLAQKMRELGDVVRGLVGSGKIEALGKAIADTFGKGADAVIRFVQQFNFGALIDKVRGGFETLSTAGSVLSTVWNGLAVVANALKAGFAGIAWTVSYIAEAAALAAHGIAGIITTITDFFGATDNATASVIESIEAVQHAARETRHELEDMAANAGEGMVSGLKSMVGVAEESTDQVAASFAKISAAAEDAAAKSTNPMLAMYQKVVDKVIEVTDTAKKEAEKQAKAAAEAAQRTKEAQEKAAVAAKDAFAGLGVDLDEVLTGVSSKTRKAMGDYTFAVEQAMASGQDATKAARAGFEAIADTLESPQAWAAYKKHLTDTGVGLEHLTKNQLKRMEDAIRGLPDVAATAMQALKQKLETADVAAFGRIKAEAKSAFESGEISAKQYADVLQQIADKTGDVAEKARASGEAAASAHQKATAAAEEEAKAKEKSTQAEQQAAEAKKQHASHSMQLYDATNLSAEATAHLAERSKDLTAALGDALLGSQGAAEGVRRISAEMAEYADSVRHAQDATDRLNALTDAGTVTLQDIAQAAQAATGGMQQLDSATLANLNAAIDAAREKLRDMKQEAEDTRASLEAQLASLRGDDSVAQSLNEQKRLRELNLKLQEAEAKGQRDIADEYRRAIELQKQVFDEERRQQQQRKAEEAKRKEEAAKRQSSSTSSNNSASGSNGKGISAEMLVGAIDERIADARKAGRDDLALELYQATKRRPR